MSPADVRSIYFVFSLRRVLRTWSRVNSECRSTSSGRFYRTHLLELIGSADLVAVKNKIRCVRDWDRFTVRASSTRTAFHLCSFRLAEKCWSFFVWVSHPGCSSWQMSAAFYIVVRGLATFYGDGCRLKSLLHDETFGVLKPYCSVAKFCVFIVIN